MQPETWSLDSATFRNKFQTAKEKIGEKEDDFVDLTPGNEHSGVNFGNRRCLMSELCF